MRSAEPSPPAEDRLKRLFLALALCALASLCAPASGVCQEARLERSPETPGTVYIYRPQSLAGLGTTFDVYAGAEKVCHLKENEYCTLKIAPGEVEVWSKFLNKGSVTLDVVAGGEHFVRASVTKGLLLFWRPHYVEVMERIGRAEMQGCVPAAALQGQ